MEKIDEFLYTILNRNNSQDAPNNWNEAEKFLLKSEKGILEFLKDKERAELEFPPLNSYYRRIIHRLGRRYNLVHRVEVTSIFNENSTLRRIFLTKPVGCYLDDLPILKCSDWFPFSDESSELIVLSEVKRISSSSSKKDKYAASDTKEHENKETDSISLKPKFKILKRTSQSPSQQASPLISPIENESVNLMETLSLEEREAKYQAARERIFEGFTEVSNIEAPFTIEPAVAATAIDSTINVITDSSETTEPTVTTDSTRQTQSQLNPDAVPFDFTPSVVSLPVTPEIKINHIYTVSSPEDRPITREELQEFIKSVEPSVISVKTRQVPTNFAFLLTSENKELNLLDTAKLTISKWEPEFYLDN